MQDKSLKKQIIWAAVGCGLLTILFGLFLSIAVNISLTGLDNQPEPLLPDSSGGSVSPL